MRLNRLAPREEERTEAGGESRRSRTAPRGSRSSRTGSPCSITGETRNDEALLRFVDNLFAHPAFSGSESNARRAAGKQPGEVRIERAVHSGGGSPKGLAADTPEGIEEAPLPQGPEQIPRAGIAAFRRPAVRSPGESLAAAALDLDTGPRLLPRQRRRLRRLQAGLFRQSRIPAEDPRGPAAAACRS